MRITTRIVWDSDFNVLEHEWYEYDGPVAQSKAEQNDVKKQELANQKTELALQGKSLDEQLKFNEPLRLNLTKYLGGDIGFSPEQLALSKSQFLNNQSQGFNVAQGQVFDALRSRGFMGGDMPASGDAAKYLSSLYGLNAATTSGGLLGIDLESMRQALANKFNTAGIFAGVGGNYGSQAVGMGNTAVGFGNSAIEAGRGRPGFLENLGNAFASNFGGGLGKAAVGGIGGLFGGNSGNAPH